MRFFAVALIFFGVAASYAQTPQVPHKIHFAGMTLTIRDDAKREIQKDVDALTRSPRYFNIKVERARTYFPIIEKIFRDEELPVDFKYLALQESSLVSDAVSPSNAVGFWQFKDFTAQEMGMRIDRDIDERMNIVSSSRSAARYIKQNNWYFNNWVLALQAYQMGKGGVKESLGDKYNGDSHMEINSETYWYVKKYLAHKIAFENACKDSPQLKVGLYETKGKRKLSDIADEVSIDESTLKEYNKWAKSGTIPDDRPYLVAIPGGTIPEDFNLLVLNSPKAPATKTTSIKSKMEADTKFHINGVLVIKALYGETVSSISKRSGLDASKFIRYNDITIDARIKPGAYYFVKHKKKKGSFSVYQTKPGDDLWLISQQQGVQLRQLKKFNPSFGDQLLSAGILVKLNNSKSMDQVPIDNDIEVAELGNEAFAWSIQPKLKNETLPVIPSDPLIDEKKIEQIVLPDSIAVSSPSQLPRAPEKKEALIYEVKGSDTLYGIARQFGATIKDIMEWNNKSTLTINPGDKLKIFKR
ncbi:MAG: LysM peptidoglycan-binding domain-containing protein [Bacteroidetes bacterium]|nr:LysM peptidoglycan-binding domain-containing protein [Bacteroidota bacterium]MBI3481465.1 LysM peptidoglycan-binding domain-containing protein [Bacteroidota bacterium]